MDFLWISFCCFVCWLLALVGLAGGFASWVGLLVWWFMLISLIVCSPLGVCGVGCRWLGRVVCDVRVVSCRLVEVGFACFGFVWWDCGLFCVLVLVLCVVCKLGGCV